MKKKNLKLSGIMLIGVIFIVGFLSSINFQPVVIGGSGWFGTTGGLNTFNNYNEFIAFLENNSYESYGWNCEEFVSIPKSGMSQSSNGRTGFFLAASDSEKMVDYSETNIQVEGVDEPDIVKTDGTYLYILANSKLYIVKANPAEKATILSIITFDEDTYIENFFINKDRLITFGNLYTYPIEYDDYSEPDYDYFYPYWYGIPITVINIYDISDKEDTYLEKNIEIDGNFYDERMINNYVYVVVTENTGNILRNIDGNISINMPEITINGITKPIPVDDIYYVNRSERIDSMTHIVSIDIFDDKIDEKSFLLGSSQNMYVSNENIYLACQEYLHFYSIWEGNYYEQYTIVHKISINNGNIEYLAKGKVPGYTLNQFSMDEHNGFFRIATQKWGDSSTNVYILNKNMNRTSEIEGIAPGETMHSARFMGDKAYLVTFKKIDPFFTLDLSDPYTPKILGELKIPGYSDYLHPYDENHIIGIGKDTVEPLEEFEWTRNFAWYQGIKIALFDVSDFKNPKEVAKVIIGDRGTDSPVLYEHKAFLFDRERELLVLPVSLYEIDDEYKEQNNGYTGSAYGKFTFQGAFVYKLSLEDGFEFNGRITHMDNDEFPDDYRWYWGSSSSDVIRSLYIDDVLYTISNNMIKMNNLNDLSEINSLDLN